MDNSLLTTHSDPCYTLLGPIPMEAVSNMLKKRELDEFFDTNPFHHLTDRAKARQLFDLMNEEPRQLSYLTEKTNWSNLENLSRFLSGQAKEYVYKMGSIGPALWALNEEAIRLKLTKYDAEVADGKLVKVRDENSPGHSINPVPPKWFTVKHAFYPYPPIYRLDLSWEEQEERSEKFITPLGGSVWGLSNYDSSREDMETRRWWSDSKSERWPLLNQQIQFDPFFTVCYILTNARGGFKVKLRKALETSERLNNDNTELMTGVSPAWVFDNFLWLLTHTQLTAKNYTFFERSFKYLPGLWTGNVGEEYGFKNSVEFILRYASRHPVGHSQFSFPGTIEDLHEAEEWPSRRV